MKKIIMYCCIVFLAISCASKHKVPKGFKPLLREARAKEILDMGQDNAEIAEEKLEIQNNKYINYEEFKETKTNIQNADKEKILKENVQILTANYQNILNFSASCCVANIAEQVKSYNRNLSEKSENIIDLLNMDAKNYYIQNTCLLLSDKDINKIIKNRKFNHIVKLARKSCICNNQDFFYKNTKNFKLLYNTGDKFYMSRLIYKSRDDQGRIIEQDMNETILNILNTLDTCMK